MESYVSKKRKQIVYSYCPKCDAVTAHVLKEGTWVWSKDEYVCVNERYHPY